MSGPATSGHSQFNRRLNQTEFEKLESEFVKKIVSLKMDSQEFQAERKNLTDLYQANSDRFPNQNPKYVAEKRILRAKIEAGETFILPAQEGVVGKAYNWMLDRLPDSVRKSGQVENFRLKAESVAGLFGPSGEPGSELAVMLPAGKIVGVAAKAVSATERFAPVAPKLVPLMSKTLPSLETLGPARGLSRQMAGLAEKYGDELAKLQHHTRLEIRNSIGKAGEINNQLARLEAQFKEVQTKMFELIPKDILQSIPIDSEPGMMKKGILQQAENYLKKKGIQVDLGKILGRVA